MAKMTSAFNTQTKKPAAKKGGKKKAPPRVTKQDEANVKPVQKKDKKMKNTETENTETENTERLPRHQKEAVKLRRAIGRYKKQIDRLEKWDDCTVKEQVLDMAGTAFEALVALATTLEELPDDFKAKATRAPRQKADAKALKEGTKLVLRPKYYKKYKNFIGEQEVLTVTRVESNGIAVTNEGGTLMFVARREVQLVDGEEAAA